jgi:DNA-binding CsgD family transcriptional regulator
VTIQTDGVSNLIGAIYDCIIEPDHWPDTLAEMCRLTHHACGVLGANLLPSGEVLLSASVGYTPQWLARLNDYSEDVMNIWGGVERIASYPLEEPIVCSRATNRATWEQNRFYKEWGKPQGLIDSVSIIVARDPTLVANVTFGRHESHGDITDSDVEILRLVGPHIRRAVTISRLLDREALAAATFAATLEGLSVAVVLVNDNLTIVHANRPARELLADRTSIRSDEGRLHFTSTAATNALRAAVSRAAREEVQLGRSGLDISVGDTARPSVAHVVPLSKRHIRGRIVPQGTAAVFVARAAVPSRLPGDALTLLYEFTPAESRIFELIVEGRTRTEIAVGLGIAPSTVKTHLLRVFDKTGLRRQADLVKLAASLSLPI